MGSLGLPFQIRGQASISEAEVHLWSSTLPLRESSRNQLYQTLSEEERERAARFRFAQDRNGYVTSRGLLRAILSRYLNQAPGGIAITYGMNGKPTLSGSPVCFNVAHSGQLVVFALAREERLGIDIEHIRPMDNLEEVARQFFSLAEYEDLLQIPEHGRLDAFFRCWTRKEAYVKATGKGLQAELDRFQVSLKPGEPTRFIAMNDGRNNSSDWSLFDWTPKKGYAGAIAIYGIGWRTVEIPAAQVGSLLGL